MAADVRFSSWLRMVGSVSTLYENFIGVTWSFFTWRASHFPSSLVSMSIQIFKMGDVERCGQFGGVRTRKRYCLSSISSARSYHADGPLVTICEKKKKHAHKAFNTICTLITTTAPSLQWLIIAITMKKQARIFSSSFSCVVCTVNLPKWSVSIRSKAVNNTHDSRSSLPSHPSLIPSCSDAYPHFPDFCPTP